MGTTNRAFSPSLHKAQMLHQTKSLSYTTRKKNKFEKAVIKESFSIKAFFTNAIKSAFGLLGDWFGMGGGKQWSFPLADFTIPRHSPYLCGRRTEDERQQRKARRQKSTGLKLKRGYA